MLNGKVALVTGASRGIGRDIALNFAKNGATVIVNYQGNEAAANETVEEIKSLGGNAVAMKCTVSSFSAVGEMVDSVINTFGKIDILVNNAGITRDNLIVRMKEEDFDEVIDVNLKGCFNTIKCVSKIMMKQRSGKIINISSVSGVAGNAGQLNYCAAKAGIIGMTKSAAKELAARNITVNAIAPGFIDTDMTRVLSDDVKEALLQQIPLKKLGNVSDISNTAVFLASDMSNYITGQVINVNGGMVM